MAVRTISTKLAIGGESEYRASVARINSELKTLESSVKLTKERFHDQANSMDALVAKGEALGAQQEAQARKVKVLEDALRNAQEAVDKYRRAKEQLTQELRENADALAAMERAGTNSGEQYDALAKRAKELESSLADVDVKLDAAERGVNSWQRSLNTANTDLARLDRELALNEQYMGEAGQAADGCATSIDQYGKAAKKSGDDSEEFGKKSSEAIDALAVALVNAGIKEALEKIRDALVACVDASVEFESAMAGVAKTTDLSDEELKSMGDALQEMSTRIPQSASALAQITEAAGQLGIQKESLLDFTEVMANLGVATNLSSEEAASALAKFANVVGMNADNYGRLGSSIVALGNNFATTEADIVSMATRLASTGAVVGLTEPQIMAVATALSSVGIEAEAGGSAISKLLKQMETSVQLYGQASEAIQSTGYSMRELEMMADQDSKGFKELAASLGYTSQELKDFMSNTKSLEQFAEVSGMSAEAFIDAWGRDAVGALDSFVVGLNDTASTGRSAVEVLDEMGITEVRLSNAVLSLASNGHILNDALQLSNQAWEENNALTKEAETRYATTESQMQLLANAFANVKAAVGDQITPALNDFAAAGTGVLTWAEGFIERSEWLVPVVGGLTAGLGTLAAGVVGVNSATRLVIPALTAFNDVIKNNHVGIAVTAVVTLVGAIGTMIALMPDAVTETEKLYRKTEELAEAAEESAKAYADQADAADDNAVAIEAMMERVEELTKKESLNRAEKAELLELIEQLNEEVPGLALAWDEEAGAINMTVEAMKDRVLYQSYEEELTSAIKRQIEVEKERAAAQANYNELLAKRQELEAAIADAMAAYDSMGVGAPGLYDLRLALDEVNAAIEVSEESLYGLDTSYNEVSETVESVAAQMDSMESALGGASGAADAAAGSMDGLADANTNLGVKTQEMSAKTREAIDALNAKYQEAYSAAYDSLMGQMNLWGDAADKTKVSVDDMIANLAKQEQANRDYHANILVIEQASKDDRIRINDELLADLTAGSEEARILADNLAQALADGNDDLVQALSDAYDSYSISASNLSSDVARIVTEFDTNMAAIQNAISNTTSSVRNLAPEIRDALADAKAAYDEGANFATGYANGIQALVPQVQQSGNEIVDAAVNAVKKKQQSNSPARVSREKGQDFGLGYALGIEDETAEAVRAAERMTEETIKGLHAVEGRTDRVPVIPSAGGVGGDGGSGANITLNVTVPEMVVRSDADVQAVSTAIYGKMRSSLRSKGVSLL